MSHLQLFYAPFFCENSEYLLFVVVKCPLSPSWPREREEMALRINVWVFSVFILFSVAPCGSFIFSELLGIKNSETERHETTNTPTLEQNSTSVNGSNDLTGTTDNYTTPASSAEQTDEKLNGTLTESREKNEVSEVRKAEEKMHIEYIKKQLMSKLRLSAPPEIRGQAPVLPLAEVGHFQTQHDQGRHKYKVHHFYAKTMQIYVMGTDGRQAFIFLHVPF